MNVADGLGDLTGQLAHLYAARTPTTSDGLDVDAALHGRAAVIGLARELLFWGTRLTRGEPPTLAGADTNPVRGLVWQLGRHPLPEATRSPIDVARAATSGSAADRWERIATQASLVQTQWGASTDKPTGPHVQTVLAEVAVLALSISHLDARLAVSAQASGRPDVTKALSSPAVHGLRHSTEATLRHLARGELPAWRATVTADRRRLDVLPVRNPTDVPRGLARLMSLLEAGTHVSPDRLHHVVRGQGRIATLLGRECATLWRATADPAVFDTGRRLHELGRSLTGATRALSSNLGSIDPSDPRPVIQAGECLRGLGFSRPAGMEDPVQRVDLVTHQAATLLYSVHAAGNCARHQVQEQRWFSAQWSEDDDVRPWSRVTQLDHPRIAPAVALGETALDLLTRPAPLAATPSPQLAMAQTASRWHAMT